ncbi:hypothetical protein JCM3765_004323 [Sporobolomyces pararoseus]
MARERQKLPKWTPPEEFWTPEHLEQLRRGGPSRQASSPQPLAYSRRGSFAKPHDHRRAPSSQHGSFSRVHVPLVGNFQDLRNQLSELARHGHDRPSTTKSLNDMCSFLNNIDRSLWDRLERQGEPGLASQICAILSKMLEDYREDFRKLYSVRLDEKVDALYRLASPVTYEMFTDLLDGIPIRLSNAVGDLTRLNQTLNHVRAIGPKLWSSLSESRASWDPTVFNSEVISTAILIEFDQTIGTIFADAQTTPSEQSPPSNSQYVARPRTPVTSITPPQILLRTPTADGATQWQL